MMKRVNLNPCFRDQWPLNHPLHLSPFILAKGISHLSTSRSQKEASHSEDNLLESQERKKDM